MFSQKFDQVKYKVLSIILFTLIGFSAACSSRGHIKFQGIPISGNLESFTGELKKLGYREAEIQEENQLKFTGRFLERECSIYLFATKKSKTPFMVRVDFSKEPYDSIKYSYERLKDHCASVLGPGASKYQQFNSSARFLFNEPRLAREPKNGDFTRYLGRKGSVILEVKYDYLSITYLDRKNNDLSEAEGGKKINPESGKEF